MAGSLPLALTGEGTATYPELASEAMDGESKRAERGVGHDGGPRHLFGVKLEGKASAAAAAPP